MYAVWHISFLFILKNISSSVFICLLADRHLSSTSTFWLLLLWTFAQKFEHVFWSILGIQPGEGLLGSMTILCLTYWENIHFPQGSHHLASSFPVTYKYSHFFRLSPRLLVFLDDFYYVCDLLIYFSSCEVVLWFIWALIDWWRNHFKKYSRDYIVFLSLEMSETKVIS